ncbi:Multidrug resistance-associated protein 1 [Manis javanica]|nr:Multidrug resistance-associated protein 1 [Manis javanica]
MIRPAENEDQQHRNSQSHQGKKQERWKIPSAHRSQHGRDDREADSLTGSCFSGATFKLILTQVSSAQHPAQRALSCSSAWR